MCSPPSGGKIRGPRPSKAPAMLHRAPTLCLLSVVLAACSSAPEGVKDPQAEAAARDRRRLAEETERKLSDPGRLITDLDKQLDAYLRYRLTTGSVQSDTEVAKLGDLLERQARDHLEFLIAQSNQTEYPRNRAIAIGTLGFAKPPEAERVLDPILNGLTDPNQEVVANAVFALGVLADPRTPPGALARVIDSSSLDSMTRGGAAWALHEIQGKVADPAPMVEIWLRVLGQPIDAQPGEVLVSALRGLGRTRLPEHRTLAERFVSHPLPLVRSAAAIALGRMKDPAAAAALLALIGPAESNENVRLAARKALQALAGGIDRGYDVEEWKRVFERGV